MKKNDLLIEELSARLKELSLRQEGFGREIKALEEQIAALVGDARPVQVQPAEKPAPAKAEMVISLQTEAKKPEAKISVPKPKKPEKTFNWEKIIGENWINKVGILILIIGVALGAKYSIENDLINPLTRIVLGYISGGILLIFSYRLRKKYESYSAVLVSGAMAIFYLLTYFAYDFYSLIPQVLAFVLMLVFTVFTVLASLSYNRSVIAHIGLVGAYAIPFILSSKTGDIVVLFSYIGLINLGILAISIKKYWRLLFCSSFFFTWIACAVWLVYDSDNIHYQSIAFGFGTLFFLQFYISGIVNKIISNKMLDVGDVIFLLLNSFIYYGIEFGVLLEENTSRYIGVFTVFNALIHFVVGVIIRNKKLADRSVFYLVLGLVFGFITIAIPIEWDGNWVTMLWAVQGLILFWVGRKQKVKFYEYLSFIIFPLAFFSLCEDWSNYHNEMLIFINPIFFTTLLVGTSLSVVLSIFHKKNDFAEKNQKELLEIVKVIFSVLLVIVAYFSFYNEMKLYFSQWEASTILHTRSEGIRFNPVIEDYTAIYKISYALIFFSLLSFFNLLKIKSKALGIVAAILILFSLVLAQTAGFYSLGELREAYIHRAEELYYDIGLKYVLVRYLLLVCIALALISLWMNIRQLPFKEKSVQIRILADLVVYTSVISFLSNELINWLAINRYEDVFKLGLSILWGVYSLALICIGIAKHKKHLRIGAIVLFSFTLLKLFFYDISDLDTISKIVVFIILGVLLLIISFLYNKFKDKISESEKNN